MSVESPEITGQRRVVLKRPSGTVEWEVTQFDSGLSYMLVAVPPGSVQFGSHFTGEQWAEFQKLIAGAEA